MLTSKKDGVFPQTYVQLHFVTFVTLFHSDCKELNLNEASCLKYNAFWLLFQEQAVPLQGWSGLEGTRKLRFPDFMTTAQDGGKVVSSTDRPPLPPGNTPGTHFR